MTNLTRIRIIIFLLPIWIMVGLTGCQENSIQDVTSGEWVLVSGGSTDGFLHQESAKISINFEDGTATGFSGCNFYQFSYSLSRDGILNILSGVSLTKKACGNKTLMDFEALFVSELASAEALSVESGTLVIANPTDDLVFMRSVAN